MVEFTQEIKYLQYFTIYLPQGDGYEAYLCQDKLIFLKLSKKWHISTLQGQLTRVTPKFSQFLMEWWNFSPNVCVF